MKHRERSLEPLFLSLLALAAGCGDGADTYTGIGTGFGACPSPLLAGLNTPIAYDGIELRRACTGATTGAPIEATGRSCSADACAERVAMLDAERASRVPEPDPGGAVCFTYFVGMKDDQVVAVATSDVELLGILGEIDTADEAALYASFEGVQCNGVKSSSGAFDILTSENLGGCTDGTQQVVYRIDAAGVKTEVQRGRTIKSNGCVGRRPAGLWPGRSRSSSEVGAYLAEAAELEAASVIAFQILERELAAHAAPASLCSRVRRAARDEVRHARTVRGLAGRFGGPPGWRVVRAGPVRRLEEMARENATEGCVLETWGALLGLWQAKTSRDPSVRRVYARIAREEVRHAELSWALAHWFDTRLDAQARGRVHRARSEAVQALARQAAPSLSAKADQLLGLPDPSTRRVLLAELEQRLWSS